METIHVCPSHYLIEDVKRIPSPIFQDLSKWNAAYFRYEGIGYYYDEKKKELRIPRGYPLDLIQNCFNEYRVQYEDDAKIRANSNIGLLNFPRDYMQESVLAYMTGNTPFENTSKESQLYVDLTTGYGKTYLMVATACYFKTKCLVLIPAISKIGNQWIDTLSNFTTLNTNEYLFVHGSEMCKDIIKGKYKNVKFFVMPRSTVLAFVRKFDNDWNMFTKLIDAMDIDVKAIDEAHMDFNTIVNIDCFSNVARTYYMSSSPSRSDKAEKKIYMNIFRDIPKFGKKLITKEQNHIIPVIIQFMSKPSIQWERRIKTKYGPSLQKYGDYLLAEDGAREEFLNAYLFTLFWLLKFRRQGGKILVICITIDFAKELKKITEDVYPYLSTGLFVGSGKDKNKELDNDIIFSTTKSMGTGSEIKNHQLTINTITYSSEVMADQISGRIRKQSGRKGIYCEIVNMAHKVARDHYAKREKFLQLKAKDGKIIKYEIQDRDIQEMINFSQEGKKFNSDGMIINKYNRIVIKKRPRK